MGGLGWHYSNTKRKVGSDHYQVRIPGQDVLGHSPLLDTHSVLVLLSP